MATRNASHAGSWYAADGAKLAAQLDGWLDAVEPRTGSRARALIAPHAGYDYSGPTAAHAYRHVDPSDVRRVFVLGPSHHVYLRGCALTACASYATPLGPIAIDSATTEALRETGLFETMALDTDEEEHSIELHLPFVQHVMRGRPYALVPILVGALAPADADALGRLLAPHLAAADALVVVSSDFCHWGARFEYAPVDPRYAHICDGIEALDRRAMDLIAAQDAAGFRAYVDETRNTICGRHPIALLLGALPHCGVAHALTWVRYAQSSAVRRADQSSVSYASAVVTREADEGPAAAAAAE